MDWLAQNKEWIFSGVGVSVFPVIFWVIWHFWSQFIKRFFFNIFSIYTKNNITETGKFGGFIENTEAYKEALFKIKEIITEKEKEERVDIDIKFTVIGMAYSYNLVILPLLEQENSLLHTNHNVYINLNILFVSPRYIDTLNISKAFDWKDQILQKIDYICRLIDNIKEKQQDKYRLRIEIRFYNEIPQHHGFVINGKHLYLSITHWTFLSEPPKQSEFPTLRVGENNYLHYIYIGNTTKSNRMGGVALFLNTHKRYWYYHHDKYNYNNEEHDAILLYENGIFDIDPRIQRFHV